MYRKIRQRKLVICNIYFENSNNCSREYEKHIVACY